jgi:hypothetical protein
VIESIKPDTKHGRYSTVTAPADGAEDTPWSDYFGTEKRRPMAARLSGCRAVACPPALTAAFGSTKTGQSGAAFYSG